MSRRFLLWGALTLTLFSCAHGPRTDSDRYGALQYRPSPLSRSCRPLTEEERNRILSEADPANFPHTRYREGANPHLGIEKVTDCSQFVHEIYRRAGLPYGFRPTSDLGRAREFDILPESEARPGDLMLFRGHVGIVGENGKIISALKTRHRKRKTSIAVLDRKYFKTFHGQRYVLRYRCPPEEPLVADRSLASVSKRKKKKR